MKPIEFETLQRIFALHIGCEAIAVDPSSENFDKRKAYITGINGEYQLELQFIDDNNNVAEEPEYSNYKDATILLKPLSIIKDDEAVEVAGFLGGCLPSTGRRFAESIVQDGYAGQRSVEVIYIIDLLRSKGYALPTYGYSVEELVAEGIFTLQA